VNRPRLATVVTALTVGAALTVMGNGLQPAAAATGTGLAPAVNGSASGGAVIVVLKDQHSNIKLNARDAQRTSTTRADQRSIVADMKANGGTAVRQLVSVNAVAAHLPAAEVTRLRANPAVAQITPDAMIDTQPTSQSPQGPPARLSPNLCPADPSKPFTEPEALADVHASSDDPHTTDEANDIATGKGVIVANDGINELAGNPNFIRKDGTPVVLDAPDPTADHSDGEFYGDASSIAGQGTVVYDYSKELPFSGLPAGCTFTIRGVAPDASLVDSSLIDTPPSGGNANVDDAMQSESQVVAGIDNAVVNLHADIISESFGFTQRPGSYAVFYQANDAAIAAGVTVVVSSGDSGDSGTVSSPATDPLAIAVGGTNTLRLIAQAYGYTKWTNDNITPLSSGGTSPNNKVVDLVAPGYGGEAACNPNGSDCPLNTQTEAFGGTSQSCPIVAGAAADVIQAYADTHGGAKPTPAMVKEILTGTATDIDAPADEQGAGLLNVYAAVRAAQQMPGTTVTGEGKPSDVNGLIPTPGQLDITDNAGVSKQSVTLFNTDRNSVKVNGSFRTLGPKVQLGPTVVEPVSAPDPSLPLPAEGGQAAKPVTFNVPRGLDRVDADMLIPDPANSTILSFTLIDPKGALTQISYDFGTPPTRAGRNGTVSNIQHVEVTDPVPGKWTAKILWANGRAHLQSPPNVPSTFTGNISFRVTGQHFISVPAVHEVRIPAHSSVTVPLNVLMPRAPGDHPQSVQFVADNGARTSLPLARRTEIPSTGGAFTTTITSSVGRQVGQISTFDIDVPAGEQNINVSFSTPDASPDNQFTFWLLNPANQVVQRVTTPIADATGALVNAATLTAANPAAGRWEIDVELNLTTSGKEFTQDVAGNVTFNQP
jgi:hypothetical protein